MATDTAGAASSTALLSAAAAGATAAPAPAGGVATPIASIAEFVTTARATFESGRTKPLAWRIQQLRAIRALCTENKAAVVAALQADLKRPELEAVLGELLTVVGEVDHALKHIKEWTKPTKVDTPPVLLPGHTYIQPEPLGCVCIIAPWNYPFQLLLNPLVAAISAGNTAVLKPSELAPACAALIEQLVGKHLDTEAIKVVQGAVPETTELLRQRFDHIMYTGNGAVAKIVMRAAAEHLTPVTLELGGKSPAIIDRDADLALTAKRLVLGKCLNAGQTCIAPDYCLVVQRDTTHELCARIKEAAAAFYGPDMKASPSFGRIVNANHYRRITEMLDTCGGTVVFGGDRDPKENYIGLTVVRDPAPSSRLITEEIFGPVLPIVTVASVEAAIEYVNARPKPLACYVFSQSSATIERVAKNTTSGGFVANDTIVHAIIPDVPFGGVGPSGMGGYHGKWGFDTYSHKKACFHQPTWIDMGALRYPPYSRAQLTRLEWLMNALPPVPKFSFTAFFMLCLIVAVIVLSIKLAQATK